MNQTNILIIGLSLVLIILFIAFLVKKEKYTDNEDAIVVMIIVKDVDDIWTSLMDNWPKYLNMNYNALKKFYNTPNIIVGAQHVDLQQHTLQLPTFNLQIQIQPIFNLEIFIKYKSTSALNSFNINSYDELETTFFKLVQNPNLL